MLQGVVYYCAEGVSFVSCGGMIMKLKKVMETGSNVKIGISKSRRRLRADTSDPKGEFERRSARKRS
jgi:hypothetical protein